MFTTINHFLDTWRRESGVTDRVLGHLTDESLIQPVAPGFRTLGDLGWHVAGSIPRIARKTGLDVRGPDDRTAAPRTVALIREGYRAAAASLARAVAAEWTDPGLAVTDPLYGQDWARGLTLQIILLHEVHHRGQMTVLMRQAGLAVPEVYGPVKDG